MRDRNFARRNFARFTARMVEMCTLCLIFMFTACWCEDVGNRFMIVPLGVLASIGVVVFLDGLVDGVETLHRILVWTAVVATTLLAWSYIPARDPAEAESKTPAVAFRGKTNIGHRLWVVPFSKDTVVLKDFEAKTEVGLGNDHIATAHGKFAIVPDESRVLAAVRIGDPEGRMRNIAEKTLASAVRMALTCPNRLDRSDLEGATLIREHERDLPIRVSGSVSVEIFFDTLTARPASCE